MNTQWFAGVNTVEEIKKLYKSLAFQHHPDRGGNTATMQEINAQYTQALKACNGQKSTSDNGEHTYRYDEQKENEIVNKINETLNSGITRQGVDLYLIGNLSAEFEIGFYEGISLNMRNVPLELAKHIALIISAEKKKYEACKRGV